MFPQAQRIILNNKKWGGNVLVQKGLLTVQGSVGALTVEVGVQVVRTGKDDFANLAADQNTSVFNPLKCFSVIVAVAVLVLLAQPCGRTRGSEKRGACAVGG